MIECRLVLDKETFKSRGFGFVSYKSKEVTLKVQSLKKMFHGREIECKLALSKNDSKLKVCEEKTRKIFVGGLS